MDGPAGGVDAAHGNVIQSTYVNRREGNEMEMADKIAVTFFLVVGAALPWVGLFLLQRRIRDLEAVPEQGAWASSTREHNSQGGFAP